MPQARLTLLNPHADDFIKSPVSFWLVRRRALTKYAYLIDEPLSRGEHVDVLVDGTLSAIFGQDIFARLPHWMRISLLWIEIAIWKRINALDGRVVVHWSPKTVRSRDFLYIFSYKSCVGAFPVRKKIIEQFHHKIINLSHYFIRTAEKAANIGSLSNVTLAADADFRRNEYFNYFFQAHQPILVLPFVIPRRFRVITPLGKRRGICAATGSFHNLIEETPPEYYRDFIGFFKSDTYHPVRKMLFMARDELKDWLACRISPYRENDDQSGPTAKLLTLLRLDLRQTSYFSFDVVDFYNDNKFAIVGEESSGLPAIGFFEAMACGCVMLGQAGSYYDGLGLEAGRHYLTHDGSIASIRSAIDVTLDTPGKLEELSQAGYDYIAERCSSRVVWDLLLEHMNQKAPA
jgi:hypothetical protein